MSLRRFLIVLLIALSGAARADIVVIVHPENPVQTLTAAQVSDLYLGRARGFDAKGLTNEVRTAVYEQPVDSSQREAFFRAVNGMTLPRVSAYWARLRFSGRILPPDVLGSDRAVLAQVRRERNAIGYIDAALVDDSVKVVLRLSL